MEKHQNGRNLRIEERLRASGLVTDEELQQALCYQKDHKGIKSWMALVELGLISEHQMLTTVAECMNLSVVRADQVPVDLDAVRIIPMEMAQRYCILGTAMEGDMLTVLTNDPLNYYGLEDVRQTTGMNLNLLLSEREELERVISYYYAEVNARQAALQANDSQKQELEQLGVEEGDDDTPVINLLNSLVERAYHNNASDIHLEPFEDKTVVRMRIDGVMIEFVTLQKSLHASLIARIKILGDMDIAKRHIPQDGHFRTRIGGKAVNTRISIMPTVFGEKAVIRLLAGNMKIDYEGTFGMREEVFEMVEQMLHAPNGILYLTGPTGSGKTTTLYMILQELTKRQVNIATIEDPIERNLPKLCQSQVNAAAGLTFETGLRAILRQDPDIIMVGETRDRETASVSVRAAITGHLVLSTLHTSDALSAIVRLEDMGVEPYLVANSLIGVVAQRLVRKLCTECAEEVEADEKTRDYLGIPVRKIRVPVGCPRCNHTGYSGRVAIHEAVRIDRRLREMIASGADMETIRRYVKQELGMKTLRERAAVLVAEGITSMEELLKASYYE